MRNSRLCSLRSRALGGRLLLLFSGAGGLQGFMVPETLAGAGAGGGGWIPEPPPWLLEWWPPLQGAWSPCPGVLTDRVAWMSPSPSLLNVTFAALHVFCSFRKVRNRPYSSPTPAILAGRGVCNHLQCCNWSFAQPAAAAVPLNASISDIEVLAHS